MSFAQALSHTPHLTVVIPVACLLVYITFQLALQFFSTQSRRLRALPFVSEKDDAQLRKSIQAAYKKYGKSGDYYKIHESTQETIIVPPRLMGEMKTLPQTEVSFSEEIYQRLTGELTGIGRFTPDFIKTISGDLTKRIPHIMGELAEETDYAFNNMIGLSDRATSIAMLPAAQRIVGLLSGRVLVGLPLAHDEEWLEAMIVHTNFAFSASERIWRLPVWLRAYVAPYLKEFRTMTANKSNVERMLAPLIQARQQAASSESDDQFDDILTRLVQNAPAEKKGDVAYHAHNQLEMSAAGLHTTAQILTQNIFNLAAYPEYYEELREELQEVLQHSSEAKTLVLSKPGLAKLWKLDSFVKETHRMHPLNILSMTRAVTAPNGHTMSNGLHIPHGKITAVNSYNIMNDSDMYPEPEKFDPFRFARMHAQGGVNASRAQYTTVHPDYPAFGQGTHSCPGRFFAATEIKVVLAHILLKYNVSFENGQARPANATLGHLQSPAPKAKVVFTPRADSWSLTGDEE